MKYLYKIIAVLSVFSMFALTGCYNVEESSDMKSVSDTSQVIELTENSTEKADIENSVSEGDNGILIVYFTAAENSGVDASSSASYSNINGEAKGRLRALADMIQSETGGQCTS
ncbi:MAG: hypothetical protein NC548_47110 [Lachnospiraceae bacterium]|nr:hypothetical protein [Lachnospiraceae bacterium]